MAVVTQRTGSAEYGKWIKALFAGSPGSGKTLLSSTFPNPYYANAEGGLMSVASKRIPYAKILNTDDLFELKKYLELNPEQREAALGSPVDTVIIDTIDEVQRILIRERLNAEKISQLRMQDYGWLGEQMQGILRGFRNLDLNVIFTVHIKDTQDEESGRVVYKPALQGAVSGEIAAYVDLSLLLTNRPQTVIEGNEAKSVAYRFIQAYPDLQYPWIKDRSGKLPETFPINFTDDYQRMHDLIFADYDDLVDEKPLEAKPIQTPVVAEKEVLVGSYSCEECGDSFSDDDQATLSRLKNRRVLCKVCYQKK